MIAPPTPTTTPIMVFLVLIDIPSPLSSLSSLPPLVLVGVVVCTSEVYTTDVDNIPLTVHMIVVTSLVLVVVMSDTVVSSVLVGTSVVVVEEVSSSGVEVVCSS